MPSETALSGLVSSVMAGSCSCACAIPYAPAKAAASAVSLKVRFFMSMTFSPAVLSAAEAARRGGVLRAVASMDVDVAVRAASRHRAQQRGARRTPTRQRAGLARVARVAVALLAQERRPLLEEVGDRRAVRLMADGTVFLDRGMVVHERTALLRVALEAGLVHGVAHQLFRGAAVHVVAGRARHHALDDRVVHRPVDLRALLLVAAEAGLGLRALVAHRVVPRMDEVAGRAGDVAARVRAHLPVHALEALVAGQAGGAALVHRRLGALAERAVGLRTLLRVGRPVDVKIAFAVAAYAGRRARIGQSAVLGLADGEHRVVVALVMAARAHRVALEHDVLALLGFLRQGTAEEEEQ